MKRLALAGLVVALVCAAGGAASAPAVKQVAAAHERAAARKAEKLLAQIPLPAGAGATRVAPAALRVQPCPTHTWFECRTRFWRFRASVATVVRFLARHPLPGYENEWGGPFNGEDYTGRDSWYDTSVVRRHGWTFVRIDASVPWFYPRSPREVVPSTVREIDIHGAGVDRTVTGAGNVKRIVRWFDQLKAVMPGLVCGPTGAPYPPNLAFTFRTAGHTEVASAVVPSGAASDCDSISFEVGGEAQQQLKDFGGGWSLSEGGAFISRVRDLLAGPKARAERKAQRLLETYVPPRGSVRLHAVPKANHLPQRIPGTLLGKRVDRHRFWLVHASVQSIESSFQDVRLRGWGTPAITSTAAKHGLATTEATFTALGFGGRATGRLLNVVAVKAHGGGSLLRVDVVVVWHLSAAERENLPHGVRVIDIRGPRAAAAVTDPRQVRTIVRWFDHLELYEPQFVAYCPVMRDQRSFTFVFGGRHGAVAQASIPDFSGICSAASYTIRGHDQTSLLAGDFDYRVQELLGANWIGPPDMLGRAIIRKSEAGHTAAGLLRAFQAPPGAVRIHKPTEYGGVLRAVPSPGAEFVQHTRFWHVDAKRQDVVSFLEAHDVPAGFTPHCGSNERFGSSQCELDARGGRFLEYAVQQKSDGTSILRVDAQVVWVYPRSPLEAVPRGVREIDVTIEDGARITRKVMDSATIGRIVRWFDRLPIYPPGFDGPMCGPTTAGRITLVFRSATGRPVADAQASVERASMCDPIAFSIHGNPQTELVDKFQGEVFALRLVHLLGVTLP